MDVFKKRKEEFGSEEKVVSAYEVALFERFGTYNFDYNKDKATIEASLAESKEWHNNSSWRQSSKERSYKREIDEANHMFWWREKFSGNIPLNWLDWRGIISTFEEANKLNLKLSDVLIEAGLTHDHSRVVEEAGTLQELTMSQLILVLSTDLNISNKRIIIEAQQEKGLSSKDLEYAIAEASKIISDDL